MGEIVGKVAVVVLLTGLIGLFLRERRRLGVGSRFYPLIPVGLTLVLIRNGVDMLVGIGLLAADGPAGAMSGTTLGDTLDAAGLALTLTGVLMWLPSIARVSAEVEERRSAETLLLDDLARTRSTIDALVDFSWQVDTRGRITHISADAATIGRNPGDLVGRPLSDLFEPVHGRRITGFSSNSFNSATPDAANPRGGSAARDTDTELVSPDRSKDELVRLCGGSPRRWFRITGRPVENADGRVIGTLGGARDVSESYTRAIALADLSQSLERLTGEDFLIGLVKQIQQALGGHVTLIGRLVENDTHIQTEVVCIDGEPASNFCYPLEGSPCRITLGGPATVYPKGVADLFPNDPPLKKRGIEGYVGRSLRDSSGRAMGILVVLSQQPIDNPELAREVISLFATRAAAELERQDAVHRIWTLNHTLEQQVADRTRHLSQEIDQRTRTEHALRQSEDRLRTTLAALSDWFWETDGDGRLTVVSPQFLAAIDRLEAAVLGQPLAELFDKSCQGKLAGHLSAWKPFRALELTLYVAEGHSLCLSISGAPFEQPDGTRGFRGAGTDVTELTQARQELVEADRMASLGRLVAGVAHEINTPIGSALTLASLVRQQLDDLAESFADGNIKRRDLYKYLERNTEQIDVLERNLVRAAKLVSTFKQVSIDQAREQRRPFNCRETTEAIVRAALTGMGDRKPDVSIRIADNLVLESYPGSYGQVLSNLLENAVRHGFRDRPTGTVRIEASPPHKGRIRLLVADNGRGVPSGVRDRIFDPFFTTDMGGAGTGLGLHIVYNIVTQVLGGRISLQEGGQIGTIFVLDLPLAAPVLAETTLAISTG